MKKHTMMTSGLVALMVATVVTGTALAAGPQDPASAAATRGRAMNAVTASVSRGFVDADEDGINDRHIAGAGVPAAGAALGYGYGFVDEDGDGVNDRYQDGTGTGIPYYQQNGAGYGFVDDDGDGLNDRRMAGGARMGMGTRFVDEDGDGLNDLRPGRGYSFVDADGDGLNDGYLDSDGDGVPDCRE